MPPVKVQTYAIDYRVLDPEFKTQAGHTGQQPALEFAVAAFDDDGKVLNGIVNDGVPETSTQASENKAGLYRVHQSLLVPVNAKSLRVGCTRSSERSHGHAGSGPALAARNRKQVRDAAQASTVALDPPICSALHRKCCSKIALKPRRSSRILQLQDG